MKGLNPRLVLPLVLLVGGTAVAFAGTAPQAALSPTQALDHGAGQAAVKGVVDRIDGANGTFILTDGTSHLRVQVAGHVPTTVAPGLTLVAEGILVEHANGTVVLAAKEIQTGCPSKYAA